MRPWIDPRLQTALAKACMASCTSRTPALDRVSSVLGWGRVGGGAANDDEMNVDGTANWVCYQEAKTEVKTEAKTEEKSKKKKVKTEEKTEEKRKVKIPRTSRQAKNATAKLDFGKESK